MDFFNKIVDIISQSIIYLNSTTEKVDSVVFEDISIVQYFGYVRYFMGDIAYSSMMFMIIVIAGVNICFFILSMVQKLKSLLPW